MPLPSWLGAVNKRVFNPREIRNGERPVLHHVGRRSGHAYQTPLATYPFDGGYAFVVMYGPGSDWVQNVLAAGSAQLDIDGHQVELDSPRVVPMNEAIEVAPTINPPPKFLGVSEVLQMTTVAA